MRYVVEGFARTLKGAREDRAMSQRELSVRAGLPQPHISRIENNGVDLRLSSIVALAHALDLELVLVPRRAVPAVQSIARSHGFRGNRGNADELLELMRARKAVAALPKVVRQGPAAVELERQLSELASLGNLFQEPDAIRRIRTAIEAVDGNTGLTRLQGLADDVKALRNRLAHADSGVRREAGDSRPAYRLDGDDDDG